MINYLTINIDTLHKIEEIQSFPQKAPASFHISTVLVIKKPFPVLSYFFFTLSSEIKSYFLQKRNIIFIIDYKSQNMVSARLQCILLCTRGFCLPQVAPVTYLRMSSHPKLYTAQGRTLSAFPLGMSLTFIVQFYNSIGEKFHTHNTQLSLALNRYGRQRNGVDIVVDILLINLGLSESSTKFLSYSALGI